MEELSLELRYQRQFLDLSVRCVLVRDDFRKMETELNSELISFLNCSS